MNELIGDDSFTTVLRYQLVEANTSETGADFEE